MPLPLLYPKEFHQGIWGGESIVQGFTKKHKYARRYPHFWFPTLKKSVVYSEVLDKYMSVVVTNRTIDLINEHYGFDHYLLKVRYKLQNIFKYLAVLFNAPLYFIDSRL